jgi:hypothetical protein
MRKPDRKSRLGRPPAGARAGEKVRDYPQVSIRVPLAVKLTLQALATLGSRPQWRIIADAVNCHLQELPTAERQKVLQLVIRSSRTR